MNLYKISLNAIELKIPKSLFANIKYDRALKTKSSSKYWMVVDMKEFDRIKNFNDAW